MLFGNDELFSVARSAKLGLVELPPALEQLRTWIIREFGVHVVHLVLDRVELGPSKDRPRLNVILETDADYKSWVSDVVTIRPEVNRRVLSQFRRIAGDSLESYDTNGMFLIVDNFSEECLGRACTAFLRTEAAEIIKDFAAIPIWNIDGFSRYLVVFLNTDKDIAMNTKNGTCAKIVSRCFAAVKGHDEFGYLSDTSFSLKFDSKENLDKNYEGSLFYYWR